MYSNFRSHKNSEIYLAETDSGTPSVSTATLCARLIRRCFGFAEPSLYPRFSILRPTSSARRRRPLYTFHTITKTQSSIWQRRRRRRRRPRRPAHGRYIIDHKYITIKVNTQSISFLLSPQTHTRLLKLDYVFFF